jgi:hypothetical protein
MSIPCRLLTSKDSDHYYAEFTTRKSYEELCSYSNAKRWIHGELLSSSFYRIKSESINGLLMPRYLYHVNTSHLRRSLQKFMKDEYTGVFKFSTLWTEKVLRLFFSLRYTENVLVRCFLLLLE